MVDFVLNFWSLFTQMAPYLLLGLVVAGVLRAVVGDAFVERHLGDQGWRGIVKATVLGIPLPLCSCGVIPVATSLYRQGATRGATVSFLISTPQTGVDSIMVTSSMLGPFFAIYRVIVSFASGILGGGMVRKIIKGVSPSTPITREIPRSVSPYKQFIQTTFVDIPRDIGKSLVVGLLIGALLMGVLGPQQLTPLAGWPGMLLALVIGIPVYVCATGSVPIVVSLVMAGMSPGAALVFLMSGPATNMATITTIASTLGKRTVAIYLGTIMVSSLASGLLFDELWPGWTIPIDSAHHEHESVGIFANICAVVLAIILVPQVQNYIRNRFGNARASSKECCGGGCSVKHDKKSTTQRALTPPQKKMRFFVDGMHCGGCVNSIERTIRSLEGVKELEVSLTHKTVKVKGSLKSNVVISALSKAGFDARLG